MGVRRHGELLQHRPGDLRLGREDRAVGQARLPQPGQEPGKQHSTVSKSSLSLLLVQMLWDAGLPEGDMDNATAVRDKIGQLERRFDLVMIAEQFDQSLVLLRDLMCWHYNDVVNFKVTQTE